MAKDRSQMEDHSLKNESSQAPPEEKLEKQDEEVTADETPVSTPEQVEITEKIEEERGEEIRSEPSENDDEGTGNEATETGPEGTIEAQNPDLDDEDLTTTSEVEVIVEEADTESDTESDGATAAESIDIVEEKVEETLEEEPASEKAETKVKAEAEVEVEVKSEDPDSVTTKNPEQEVEKSVEDETYVFTEYTKDHCVEFAKELSKWESPVKAERVLRDLKERFEVLKNADRKEALDKFIADGGEEDGFSYVDHQADEFEANEQLIRDRKSAFVKNQERSKHENLAAAEDILTRLREFIDSDESNTSFKKFKEFQEEWKGLTGFPAGTAKSLWANYNALVSRFYDARSIYFELKELDRKKNLEVKLELCKKAEDLASQEDLNDAIMQLNELHEEFKHTGPVPQDQQESVWIRFKAASDQIYARRKEENVKIKEQLKGNEEKKLAVIEKISPYTAFTSDRIKEWNVKTKEVLAIQKEWEAIGPIPKENAKSINKQFWSGFKSYFNNKNQFFKTLEKQRQENLNLKEKLVERVEALKESEAWEDTAKELKNLQKEWREIGPVPEKVRNEIYQKFKDACDTFFDRRRKALHVTDKDFEINLKKKEEIIGQIDALGKNQPNDLQALHGLINQYYEIGFVPKNDIKKILNSFNTALDGYLELSTEISGEEKEQFKLENKLEKLKHSPNADKRIHHKEQALRKQISSIENDISVWRNNIEFFANTKNGDKYRDEFGSKIEEANSELGKLKKELRMLRSN